MLIPVTDNYKAGPFGPALFFCLHAPNEGYPLLPDMVPDLNLHRRHLALTLTLLEIILCRETEHAGHERTRELAHNTVE